MQFDVLTLFPEIFSGYTTQSILNKAIQKNLVSINVHNMREGDREKPMFELGGAPELFKRPRC